MRPFGREKTDLANPQKENGYTPISNEILDALIKTKINSDAWKLTLFIIRKTYGFNKKQDKIALSQFVLATQLKKSVVCRGLNRLQNMNIIIRIANDECTIYRFNKDFDTWKPLAKLLTLAKQQTTVSRTANESLAKQRHTKDNIQKTLLQKTISEHGSQAIVDFINLWKDINPAYRTLFKNKTERSASSDLLKISPMGDWKIFIPLLQQMNAERYAKGKSTKPSELLRNIGYFKAWIDQKKGKSSNRQA